MSALSIQPTYPIFTETDGQPLEDGYIWIGTANLDPQTNPINVYWDAALTQIAAQPVRTEGGYPVNSGTPARLYVNSDYSIRVLDKKGSLIYSALSATERYNASVITSVNVDASDVTFTQAGANAVQRTVQLKLEEFVNVDDFIPVGFDTLNNDCQPYMQDAVTAALGKVLKMTDGKSYRLGNTLDLTGLRGFVGAAYLYWAGPLNGVMLDASKNSGIIISGGVGEMIVRADTPVVAEVAFKMGGTPGFTTFQSAIKNVSIVGGQRALPNYTIAIDGGPSASDALNDGEFHHVRIDGFNIGYRFGAPDQKIFGGTCRVATGNTSFGAGISLENNGRANAYGWVVSQANTAIRCTHGVWGAAFYGCWFEGIVSSVASVAPAGSEIYEGLSFYNSLFSTDAPAAYLFDLQEWQPGAVGIATQGQFRLIGCNVSPVSNNSNIRLHSNPAYTPLSVEIYGMQNATVGVPLSFTGFTQQVFWQENGGLKIGSVSGGIARHLTAAAQLTFPSIPGGARDGATVSVPGVRVTSDSASVVATPIDGVPQTGLLWFAYVSANDTVTVAIQNTTGGALTPTVLTWRVEVFTH